MSELSIGPQQYKLSDLQTKLATKEVEISPDFLKYRLFRAAMRGVVPDGLVLVEQNATDKAHEKRLVALREEQSSEPLRPLVEIISNAFDAQIRFAKYIRPSVEIYVSTTPDGSMNLAVSDRTRENYGDGMTPEIFFTKYLPPYASGNDTGVTIGTMGVGAQQGFGLLRSDKDRMNISSVRDGTETLAHIKTRSDGDLYIVPGGRELKQTNDAASGTIVTFHLTHPTCTELGLNEVTLQKYLQDKFAGYPGELKIHFSGVKSGSAETILTHKPEDIELIGNSWDIAKIKYTKNIAKPGNTSKVHLTMMGVTFGDSIEVAATGLPEKIFLDIADKSLVTEGRKTVRLNEHLLRCLTNVVYTLYNHMPVDMSLRIGLALEPIISQLGDPKNLPPELRLQPQYDLKDTYKDVIRTLISQIDDKKFVVCPACLGDMQRVADGREMILIPDIYTKDTDLIPLESLSILDLRRMEGFENANIYSATFPSGDMRLCVEYNGQYLINNQMVPDLYTPNGRIRLRALFENLQDANSKYPSLNIVYSKSAMTRMDNIQGELAHVSDATQAKPEQVMYDKEDLNDMQKRIKAQISTHKDGWIGYSLDQKKQVLRELARYDGSDIENDLTGITEKGLNIIFKTLSSDAFSLNYGDFDKLRQFISATLWKIKDNYEAIIDVYIDLHELSNKAWFFDLSQVHLLNPADTPMLLALKARMPALLDDDDWLSIGWTNPTIIYHNKMQFFKYSAPDIFRYLNKGKPMVEETIELAKKLKQKGLNSSIDLLMSHPNPLSNEQITTVDMLLTREGINQYRSELLKCFLDAIDMPEPMKRADALARIVDSHSKCKSGIKVYNVYVDPTNTFLSEIRHMSLEQLTWVEKVLQGQRALSEGSYHLDLSLRRHIKNRSDADGLRNELVVFLDNVVPRVKKGELSIDILTGYLLARPGDMISPHILHALDQFILYAQSTNLTERFESYNTNVDNWVIAANGFLEKIQQLDIPVQGPSYDTSEMSVVSPTQLLLEDLAPGQTEFSKRAHADAKRELLHPINRCVDMQHAGYPEVIKNAFEAIDRSGSAERKIVISDYWRPAKDGTFEYWLTCEDWVGMDIFDAMKKLTLPSKGEGMHGIGFLKLLADADRVIVQTGDGKRAGTIVYTPTKDDQGIITDLKMEVRFDTNEPIRKGTVVHICRNTTDPVPVVIAVREKLTEYVQAVPEHIAQVILMKSNGTEQILNHAGSEIVTYGENGIGVHFQQSHLASIDSLSYAGRGIGSHRSSVLIRQSNLPKGVAQLLNTSDVHIDLAGIRLTRDGSGIVDEERVLDIIRRGIGEKWREIVQALLQTGKLEVSDFLLATLGPRVFDSPKEACLMPMPPTDLSTYGVDSDPHDLALFLYKSPSITIPTLGASPMSLSDILIQVGNGLIQPEQLPPRLVKLVVESAPLSSNAEQLEEGVSFTQEEIKTLKPILEKGAQAVGIQDVSFVLAGEQNQNQVKDRVIPTSVTRGNESARAYYRPGFDSLHFGVEWFMEELHKVTNPNKAASVVKTVVHELVHAQEGSEHAIGVHPPKFYRKVQAALLRYQF